MSFIILLNSGVFFLCLHFLGKRCSYATVEWHWCFRLSGKVRTSCTTSSGRDGSGMCDELMQQTAGHCWPAGKEVQERLLTVSNSSPTHPHAPTHKHTAAKCSSPLPIATILCSQHTTAWPQPPLIYLHMHLWMNVMKVVGILVVCSACLESFVAFYLQLEPCSIIVMYHTSTWGLRCVM